MALAFADPIRRTLINEMTPPEFQRLLSHREPWSVSILMPGHLTGPEVRQDAIRLKNLLNRAEEQLKVASGNKADGRVRVDPIRPLVDDFASWGSESDGLAIFSSSEGYKAYRVPVPLEEAAVVDDRFHLKPMIPLVTENGAYFVLALSQSRVRLFQGSKFELREVELKDAPGSIEDIVRFVEEDRSLQYHTSTGDRVGASDRAPIYHGHGGGADEARRKKRVEEFCHLVDVAVNRELAKHSVPPLLLLGNEPVPGLYREISEYKNLNPRVIQGNADQVDTRKVRDAAVAALGGYFDQERQMIVEQFDNGLRKGLASLDVNKIAEAVAIKRVDRLFVALGENIWCKTHPETGKIEMHDTQEAGDHDLLNRLALEVCEAGGKVFAAPREELPQKSHIAATFRYPIKQ